MVVPHPVPSSICLQARALEHSPKQITMSIGALVLKLQQKYKHGPATAHWRDRVRPQILETPPVRGTVATDCCELHVLTSAGDWLNLIWGLKSFYHYSGRRYALCIHGDPSLTAEQQATLQAHFPDARIVDRQAADARAATVLADYPQALALRQRHDLSPNSPKIFDFPAYLESDRLFLFDSDLLFFQEPTELLRRLEDPDYQLNSVNGDTASAYTVDPAIVREKMGFEVIERFNSGLGVIHRQSLSYAWLEEFLTLPDITSHFWRIEQTLFALCSSRYGAELLPPEYDVRLEDGIGHRPMRHYVGTIRHLLYREGIAHLSDRGFLQALERG